MKYTSRRELILYHWHQGRSIEGIALELAAHGYDNNTCKSIREALKAARKAGYSVAPTAIKPRGEPSELTRADLGKFQRPEMPDGAAPLLDLEIFAICPEFIDLLTSGEALAELKAMFVASSVKEAA